MCAEDRTAPRLVLAAEAELAEGPFWLDGELWWIDANRGELHRTDAGTGVDTMVRFDTTFGAVVPTSDRVFLAAASEGFGVIRGDRIEVLDPVAAGPSLFMNDGACDAAGRFWASVNGIEDAPGRGSLHVWEPGGGPSRCVDEGFTLLNGIGWSPDNTVMYVVDSVTRRLYGYRFDLATGTVSDRRVVFRFDPATGLPDGLAVDVEGGIWVACYDGGQVLRIDPGGGVTARIRLPVSRPTSCAFGAGHDLYITSAREGLTGARLRREPLAGSIWVADAGIAGTPVAFAAAWAES